MNPEKKSEPKEKVCLAYSGGLDTSVAIKWMADNYGCEVVAVTVDVGQPDDLNDAMRRAKEIGAARSWVVDAKKEFVEDYIFPSLKANALYEGKYPLSTAIARPLIAKKMVEKALSFGATAVAHGCTAKGNDQVRFEVSFMSLAPELKIYAPTREWGMNRAEEVEYAEKYHLPCPVTKKSIYSIDESLWGRACECGPLDDPWTEPPEDAFKWTTSPKDSPDKPTYVEIEFDKGIPVAIDGKKMAGLDLITLLNDMAGKNGVGRIDMIENRLVGIKSREVYECPAAVCLITAHADLETLVMTKDLLHYKRKIEQDYADLLYNGLWFSPLKESLDAFIDHTQAHVTGKVKLKLFKGSATVVGRQSPYSLYDEGLVTYQTGDVFDHTSAKGFIYVWGLPSKVAAVVKRKKAGAKGGSEKEKK
jgi:argininosuccinate synthase